MVQMSDPADFLEHIERRLAEGVEMTNRYLHPSSKAPLLATIENTLLRPHVRSIVEKGLPSLLEGNRLANLRRMYLLLDRVGSTSLIRTGWVDFIRRAGENLVSLKDSNVGTGTANIVKDAVITNNRDKDKTIVEEILLFHDCQQEILRGAFSSQEEFRGALRASFEYVPPSLSAPLSLSLFLSFSLPPSHTD